MVKPQKSFLLFAFSSSAFRIFAWNENWLCYELLAAAHFSEEKNQCFDGPREASEASMMNFFLSGRRFSPIKREQFNWINLNEWKADDDGRTDKSRRVKEKFVLLASFSLFTRLLHHTFDRILIAFVIIFAFCFSRSKIALGPSDIWAVRRWKKLFHFAGTAQWNLFLRKSRWKKHSKSQFETARRFSFRR